jgi:DNA-binding NtrC family response regulator
LDKERGWLTKAVLRGGYIPTRDRDGESAPFLCDLRSMSERGLAKGMPWRITKFGRDCLRELEAQPGAPQQASTLPLEVEKPPMTAAVRKLAEVERELIAAAMVQFDGNKTHAALALGISVRTIRNKLRSYGKMT